jgi:hypothetical protein
MKRIVFAVLISLSSALVQVPATASTDGCPDSWSIDLTKFPSNPELIQAKQTLGPKMVETQIQRTMINYKGELGDMPPLPELAEAAVSQRSSYWYLLGKSDVETIWKVEVKDCPNPGLFKFRHKIFGNIFDEVQESSAAEWSKNNEKNFVDFKKQEAFAKDLLEANIKSQEMVNSSRSRNNGVGGLLLLLQVFPYSGGLNSFVGNSSISLQLQALTPGCIGVSKKVPGFSELVLGKQCKFAWSVLERVEPSNPTNQKKKLVMFEPFNIDASLKTSTITCVKGKLSKKVTAVSPKCPSGYRKK